MVLGKASGKLGAESCGCGRGNINTANEGRLNCPVLTDVLLPVTLRHPPTGDESEGFIPSENRVWFRIDWGVGGGRYSRRSAASEKVGRFGFLVFKISRCYFRTLDIVVNCLKLIEAEKSFKLVKAERVWDIEVSCYVLVHSASEASF